MAKAPTAEQLREWFTALTPRQRIELSPMFTDRAKYTAIARESIERSKTNRSGPSLGGMYERMFADPFDVFVSPWDGKPFVIGYKRVPPTDPRWLRPRA